MTVGRTPPQGSDDSFELRRFVDAQDTVWATVTAELRAGLKRTHWIWFVFPQLRGLGHSATAHRYGIASSAEAQAYATHPVLGPRLSECSHLLLRHANRPAREILGHPDDLKVRSSMTLFAHTGDADAVFGEVLTAFYDGQGDPSTLALLG